VVQAAGLRRISMRLASIPSATAGPLRITLRLFAFGARLVIMYCMKRLMSLLVCSGAILGAADLSGVHSVYVMPMSRALDQYLANRLTNDHVFQVVTDPKLADAIFTDRIGEAFQIQLETISPTPKPPKPDAKNGKDGKEAAVDVADKDAKPTPRSRRDRTEKTADSTMAGILGADTVNKTDNPALNSTFGRGKGTVFLVDAKTRQVVWSTFNPAKIGSDNHDMDRTASDIVSRIRKDLNPNPKKK
jgi:hypothetical protein